MYRGRARAGNQGCRACVAARREHRYRDRGRLDDRFREREPAGLLEHQHEVDLIEAEPTVGLRREYTEHAHLREIDHGVSWQNEHWRLAVGYEVANWFNMVNSLDFPDGSSVGHIGRRTSDLSLEALSVQAGFVF